MDKLYNSNLMLSHKVCLEAIAGDKSFLLYCDQDTSLQTCLEAIKIYELYLLDRVRQAQESLPVEDKG